MEFFVVILINIFMGAVFYLFITLKLERSASEFREQRLRREMDEIIREFNSAAERNISLLENRISQYKKLLGKTGDYDEIDFTIGREDFKSANKSTGSSSSPVENFKDQPLPENETGRRVTLNDMVEHAKNKFDRFRQNLAKKIPSAEQIKKSQTAAKTNFSPDEKLVEKISAPPLEPLMNFSTLEEKKTEIPEEKFGSPIEKSFSDIFPGVTKEISANTEIIETQVSAEETFSTDEAAIVTYDEIKKIVESGADKMSIVLDLHSRGLHADEISGYTGIPQGEIKLIMNLSSGGR